jgi:tRNA-splicing ligase RtcB
LDKIADGIWEMKKEGRMRVDARVFATEKMLSTMGKDRTFSQLKNVATLPGIVGKACLMPDGHEGYGFPIGGVAAFDPEQGGVVSPGGVGYDINCTSKDAKILTEFGFYMPIEKFATQFESFERSGGYLVSMYSSALQVRSLSGSMLSSAKPVAFMSKKADKRMLEVKARCGKKLVCSEDHPILTRKGMVKAGELAAGKEIAVSLFEGVEFEQPANFAGKVEELAIWAKLLGYMMGDGTLYTSGGKMRAVAYGKREDLEAMQKDVERLGFHSHIVERHRQHAIETQYGRKEFSSSNCELHVYSQEFCKKLAELGMPMGKKTSQDYRVPSWLFDSPKWVKRLFLAGLFGAELTSPKTHSRTGFNAPIFAQNKNGANLESGRLFMLDVMRLLEEFGVKTTKLAQRSEHVNREGKTCRLRLEISADEENLFRLFTLVGIEYSTHKSGLSEIASLYIKRKQELSGKRAAIAARVRELRQKGVKLSEAQSLLCSAEANARFIERAYYEKRAPRISQGFEPFEKFAKRMAAELSSGGVLFDEIASVSEVPYDGVVYDFTIEGTHNFVADGIIVSNCGVRLIATQLTSTEVRAKIRPLVDLLFRNVPSGVGSKGKLRVSERELEEAVTRGIDWAIDKGYGTRQDKERTEEGGRMEGADPSAVSDKAKKRGLPQFGTVGAGNHFVEIQDVQEIMLPEVAEKFGVKAGDAVVMLHCGSRGFGHQVCDDSLREMLAASRKYGISLPDPELCCAPINTPEAEKYVKGMKCAVNYAFCNRHIMMHWVRETFDEVFGKGTSEGMPLVYDVCHNIAKFEEHMVDGQRKTVCVHRKGATRAFAAGRTEVPPIYRDIGQPVIIPGSMGTASYLLVGKQGAMDNTFGSTCHGAGRVMSRSQAIRTWKGNAIAGELANKGILVKSTESELLAEEAPGAYKDVDEVVLSVKEAGITDIVARLKPMGVVKG